MNKVKNVSKEMCFFTYLLENYAVFKKQRADIIFQQLDDLNLVETIFNNYEMYHRENLNNAFSDIDLLIQKTKQFFKNLKLKK